MSLVGEPVPTSPGQALGTGGDGGAFSKETQSREAAMFHALQVLAILLVALATALAVAHALEMPGKLRLSKDAYLTTQTIYYPGFTFGGICEPLGVIMLLVLIVLTPSGAVFWLTLGALIALAAMHAVYWAATHPVNNFWLKDFQLKGATGAFFLFDPL